MIHYTILYLDAVSGTYDLEMSSWSKGEYISNFYQTSVCQGSDINYVKPL